VTLIKEQQKNIVLIQSAQSRSEARKQACAVPGTAGFALLLPTFAMLPSSDILEVLEMLLRQ
jgi:hypothetical protein